MSVTSHSTFISDTMATISETIPMATETTDAFRGVFIDLVDHSTQQARNEAWLLSERPSGGNDYYITAKGDSGPNRTYTYAAASGVYGEGCMACNCHSVAFTTNFASNDRQLISPGHGIPSVTQVALNNTGGSLPAGMTEWKNMQDRPQWAVNCGTDTLEVYSARRYSASNDAGDLLFTATTLGDHLLEVDDKVQLQFGTVPGGLDKYVDYWVVSVPSSTTFKLSDSQGGTPFPFVTAGTDSFFFCSTHGEPFTDDGTGTHAVTTSGLPGFWFGIGTHNGSEAQWREGVGTAKFLGPITSRPYNTFEWFVKYPAGFRQAYAAPSSGYESTIHLGTYHSNSASSNEEVNGYHFYILPYVRHDLENTGQWKLVRTHARPGHIRDAGTTVFAPDVTAEIQAEGTFWDTFTRGYIDEYNYAMSAEIFPGSYQVLYDRMRLYYQDYRHPVTIAWDTFDNSNKAYIEGNGGTYTDFWFTLTNTGDTAVTGWIMRGSTLSVGDNNVYDSVGTLVTDTQITVPASGSWQGYMRYGNVNLPYTAKDYPCCVTFTPLSERSPISGIDGARSFADQYVEHWKQNTDGSSGEGPLDSHVVGVTFSPEIVQRVTFDGDTNQVTLSGHSLSANTTAILKLVDAGDELPVGLSEGVSYKVFEPGTDVFKLSTDGISAIDFTGNGTSSSGYFWVYR